MESNSAKPIGKVRGALAVATGLVLLLGFGAILLDVAPTLYETGSSEPATLLLAVFAFMLAGLGAGLVSVGYGRLAGTKDGGTRHQLSAPLLLIVGLLFLGAGIYSLLSGSVKGGVFLVLGVAACILARQRRTKHPTDGV